MSVKFSKANSKLIALTRSRHLKNYLKNDKKVYSFDILSGWSCPHAKDCLAKVHERDNGARYLVDGKDANVRCFSAMQEVIYRNAYFSRKNNFQSLKACSSANEIENLLLSAFPKNAGIVRIHVSGDFFNRNYFNAWLSLIRKKPQVLFYAYTKSLDFWVDNLNSIPNNLILTASKGGRLDHLIDEYNLRKAVVVFSPEEARKLKLKIDHTDENAAIPSLKNKDFALLIHGQQKKGSKASKAISLLRKRNIKFSYSKKAA